MDDDDLERISATLVAHDMMLQFMFANLFRAMPPPEAKAMVETILKMPGLEVPEGLPKDFDAADRLAGIAISVREQMKRIVEGALKNF